MSLTEFTSRYRMSFHLYLEACVITRTSDASTVFLQGEDAETLRREALSLEAIWAEGRPEDGPFQRQEDHLDWLLSSYDELRPSAKN